ncbi:MAG: hypothetical protein U1A78_27185 [Polyangia bacterium]
MRTAESSILVTSAATVLAGTRRLGASFQRGIQHGLRHAPRLARGLTARGVAMLVAITLLASCDLLGSLGDGSTATPPGVQASALQLQRRPTITQLAAYYCPVVITDSVARLGCSLIIGPPPPQNDLRFEFGIQIDIHNPNDVPVPALDVLLALKLFEAQSAEALGAICISLCGASDPTCDGRPRPGACESTQKDIRTLDDFTNQIPSLISDVLSGRALEELRKSTVAAGGDVRLNLAFALGVDQALRVFQRVALQFVNDLLSGRSPTLVVPVSAEGSVFFNLPVVGRLGVAYGPLQSSWKIDSTLLN